MSPLQFPEALSGCNEARRIFSHKGGAPPRELRRWLRKTPRSSARENGDYSGKGKGRAPRP